MTEGRSPTQKEISPNISTAWGDPTDQYNEEAKGAKEKGWLNEQNQLTPAGQEELNRRSDEALRDRDVKARAAKSLKYRRESGRQPPGKKRA